MSKIRPDSAPQNRPLSRRSALKIGAGAAAVSAIGFPAVLRAQSEAIRIGHLTPMTGFLGTLGEWAVMGIQMAAEEIRSEEHTSELQSLMRRSYAVFCLNKKKRTYKQ